MVPASTPQALEALITIGFLIFPNGNGHLRRSHWPRERHCSSRVLEHLSAVLYVCKRAGQAFPKCTFEGWTLREIKSLALKCERRNHRSYTSHTMHGTYLASNLPQNRVQGDECRIRAGPYPREEENGYEGLPGAGKGSWIIT